MVIQPSGADIWASAAAVKMIQQKQSLGGQISAAFVVNRTSSNTKLSKSVVEGEWNEYGLEQMSATVGNRTAFAQAITEGVSVYDLADGTARAEIDLLIQELEDAKWL